MRNCIRAVGDQAAAVSEIRVGVHSRQSVAGGERDDEIAMNHPWWSSNDDQTTVRLPRERDDAALDFAGLDRVAQIPARPFRLGLTRKVSVFPICPPAAL